MLARVPEFVASLERLGLDLAALRAQLKKPLRPMWLNRPDGDPSATLSSAPVLVADGQRPQQRQQHSDGGDAGRASDSRPPVEIFDAFHPIVCCTSSRRVAGTEMSESGYIQGAGDDTENWAHGLTPSVFWANAARLLATPETGLPRLIRELASEAPADATAAAARHLTAFLSVSALPLAANAPTALPAPAAAATQLTVLLLPNVTKPESWTKSPTAIEVGLGKGKIASRNLRQALPIICAFVQSAATAAATEGAAQEGASVKVLVACESGRDVSVGVALALACHCFDDRGNVLSSQAACRPSPTKDFIRTKLGRIVTAMPEANPSRATLQSVNSFLMDWRE